MKIFISWSGERSKQVAVLLKDWLQHVNHIIKPWMSSHDIDNGAVWFNEISNQLAETKIGIACLTNENKDKPWILFEAGALAKGLSSTRVCTFLIDLSPNDLGNPLAQFNHSFPTKENMFKLIKSINRELGDLAMIDAIQTNVFETFWPQFEESFELIIKGTHSVKTEKRSSEETLEEILSSVRLIEKQINILNEQQEIIRMSHNIKYTEADIDEQRRFNEQKKALEERADRLRRMSFNIKGEDNETPAYMRRQTDRPLD